MDHPDTLYKLAQQRHQQLLREAEIHRLVKQASPTRRHAFNLPKVGHVLAAIGRKISTKRAPQTAPSAC